MTTMTVTGTVSGAPTREDGTLHRYELVYAGHTRRVYADTEAALIDVLIPEYVSMSEQQQWEARLSYMIRAQVIAQAGLNAVDAFETLDHTAKTILQGPRHEPPVVPTWACPVPLVLIASFYTPAGTNPRPVSEAGMEPNIIWVDPSDDVTFLNSLHDIGVISLYVSG
jgi:hypothetical protein